jgi:hypothetical protein
LVTNKKGKESQKMAGDEIIIAPHYDDEIIGCFEILMRKPIVIYTDPSDQKRKEECHRLFKEEHLVKAQYFSFNIPPNLLDPKNTYYFPDPVYEVHPSHRKWGAVGESMLRSGFNIIFYSIQMNAPYIHEVEKPNEKKRLLDLVYPSQISLWDCDAKYYLFEGRCKWLM